jgi:hypothetical protein
VGRVFPWGNEYRAGCANIDETSYCERVGPCYLGRVVAVGLYLLGGQPNLDFAWASRTWVES